MSKTWFTCRKIDDEADIAIYDEIGAFGITAKDFADDLKSAGPVSHINLSINSPGGEVFDGLTIFNVLRRHRAHVTVRVDGIAASIASVIAMAGDAVLMPSNAMMMVHDPSGLVIGTSKEMRELADALDKIKGSLIAAYETKTGMHREEIARLMADETWLSAEEAVSMGFADAIESPVQMAASFDLSKFKNAPANVAGRKSGPAATCQPKENTMTDKTKGAEVQAAATDKQTEAPEQEAKVETPTEMEARIRTEVEAEIKAKAETEAKAEEKPEASRAEIESRIRDEMQARFKAIDDLCFIAGASEKAPEFMASGKSVDEVRVELRALRAAGGVAGKPAPELNARHGASTGGDNVDPYERGRLITLKALGKKPEAA